MAQLKTARRLGISYKRFCGWQPTDDDPIEWDETERSWMLALDEYENTVICPLCGMPSKFCHDYLKVNDTFERAKIETCFVSAMREQAMEKYLKDDRPGTTRSQTTKLVPFGVEEE